MDTLFVVTLFELFVGGGGRLLEIGPYTTRMALFALCLLTTVLVALPKGRPVGGLPLAVALVTAYLIVHLSALANGALAGMPLADMFLELQQSLYWLAAPYFAVVLDRASMVHRAAAVARVAGIVLAAVYLGAIALLASGVLDFARVYTAMSESSEFFFRGESFFFYKGFLYLGIGSVFLVSSGSKRARWLAVVVLTAMALTITRGFVISTSVALLLMLAAQRRWRLLGVVAALAIGAAVIVWGLVPSADEGLSAQREISNQQRIEDMDFIADNIDARTVLVGRGLGVPINERGNVENTLVWALWRLGLPGVVFWTMPLLICARYYLLVPRRAADYRLAGAFMFSTLLVYIQTLSNPYLNNPIGLSFILVAVFSLRTLSRPFTGRRAMSMPGLAA